MSIEKLEDTVLEKEARLALGRIVDPELAVDIVTLGLIRDIKISSAGDELQQIHILMTLTTPLCPFADIIIQDVETEVTLLGYGAPIVSLSFDPPWEVTPELKLLLGL